MLKIKLLPRNQREMLKSRKIPKAPLFSIYKKEHKNQSVCSLIQKKAVSLATSKSTKRLLS